MTVPYTIDSSSSHYKHYYTTQTGGGISIFCGKTIQHGSGLGSVFSKIYKGIAPVLKQVAKSGGKELLKVGNNIVNDVVNGKSFTKSTKHNLSEGGKRLLKSLSTKVVKRKVGGTKRRTAAKNKPSKTKKRRLNNDIFA